MSHHHSHHHRHSSHTNGNASHRGPTFSKMFRWQPEKPHDPKPSSVEIVGSFSDWHRVPLAHDPTTNTWAVTLHQLPGNRTHHYMLLVNGQPAKDKNANGLTAPENDWEKRYQLETPRGPRVFMLFSDTK